MSDNTIIKEPTVHLPQAYRNYTDPETGVTVVGETADSIVASVQAIRLSKGLDTVNVRGQVEDFICSRLPSWCERKYEKGKVKKEFTKMDVLAFLGAVKGTLQSGGVVDQTTAETRANMCLQCPYNQKIAGCEGCNGIADTVFSIIGKRRVCNIGNLKSCGICGCSLKAKIWVPQKVLHDTARIQDNMDDFPSWCWVNK